VNVLDDGAMESVKLLAVRFGFNYIRRDDRPRLKKAGNREYQDGRLSNPQQCTTHNLDSNLRPVLWAFTKTDGEFFVIFDAVSWTGVSRPIYPAGC
jgi:hypothetical protein